MGEVKHAGQQNNRLNRQKSEIKTMPNTVITSTIISKELLMQFENSLIVARKVDWQYNDKFATAENKIGAQYRVRIPVLFSVNRNNLAYSAQAVTEKYTQLTVANSYTIPFTFTDADLALKIEDFSQRYVKQAVAVLAATFDTDIANAAVNSYVGGTVDGGVTNATPNSAGWVVGSYATALTSDTILNAFQLLLDSGCPDDGEIVGVLSPRANRQLANAQLTLFNAQESISRIYTKGYIGDFSGIEFNVSQSMPTHQNGTQGTLAVTAAAGNDYTAWAETGTLTVTALTGAVKAGDMFVSTVRAVNPLTKAVTANYKQFQVVTDAAIGATTVTVSPAPVISGPDQNVATSIASTTLTLIDATSAQGQESLIFHRAAIAAVSPKFEMPKKSSFDMAEEIDENELRVRFLRGYDMVGSSGSIGFVSRLDSFLGFKTLRPDWIVRVRHN